MEAPQERVGDNLYPVAFTETFAEYEIHLDVPSGVWNPTPHGVHLGNVLAKLDFHGQSILELGTGCGIHAILLAHRGAQHLTLTEIDQPTLDNARHNLERNGVHISIEGLVADWTHLPDSNHDLLITNPPFTKSGKRYRRYFIDTLILNAHKLVKPGGQLMFVQSSMANVPRSILLMEECGMTVEVLGETDGPFRNYYFDDAAYLKEMAAIPGAYTVRDGVHYERLIVLRGTLPG
ncbi:MAG: methyltransferase [Planctomycetota bacterium]